jgi:Zn-dependent protease
MDQEHLTPEDKQRIENLHIVAEHLAARKAGGARDQDGEKKTGIGSDKLKRWGALGILLVFVLGKFKWVLMIFKFAKFSTLITMIASVWVYATLWGFPFALGFVLLIFVHEAGHALMMRQQNIPAGAPVFIPFVGAVIAMKGMPRDAYVEALVGIGGPALGTLGAMLCLVVGWSSGYQIWYALAYTGFMINLFNMIPIPPLDGGRITPVLSRWVWVAGLAIGVVVFLQTRSPLLFLILLLGAFTFFKNFKTIDRTYYNVPSNQRIVIGVSYFGLLAVMTLGMWMAGQALQNLGVIGA